MSDLARYTEDIAAALQMNDIPLALSVAVRISATSTPTSDEEAANLTDAAKLCKVAADKAKDELKTVTGPLREAEQAARNLAAPVIEQLEGAVKAAKMRLSEWMAEKARRAAAEQAERDRIAREERERVARELAERDRIARLEAERVAREQAAADQIALEGEVPVPEVRPAVVPEVRPASVPEASPTLEKPKQVRGAASVSSGRKIFKFLAADSAMVASVHPEWLELNTDAARDGFKGEVLRWKCIAPHLGDDVAQAEAVKSFAAMGILVTIETSVSIR